LWGYLETFKLISVISNIIFNYYAFILAVFITQFCLLRLFWLFSSIL